MTGASSVRSRDRRPPEPTAPAESGSTEPDRLEDALDRLTAAIEAGDVLGLPTSDAQGVRSNASQRLGFPGDVYVLALVGGTGVGKSSLLNALAGEPVSDVGVRRPTTDEPIAWLPGHAHDELDGLLSWLEIGRVREYAPGSGNGLKGIAVLDLPDMDSVEARHRERVEQLLPRVDAVAWVTDPEKYHDAVLHDEFLRTWLPRLDRQAVVLNKRDRLAAADVEALRRDLERDLAATGSLDGASIPVLVTSAVGGEAGMTELHDWLAAEVDAKRVVRDRLRASVTAATDQLARAAGLDPSARQAPEPFVSASERQAAITAVTERVLSAVDLDGLADQAVAATRARARVRGTGPMGLLTSAIYRFSGRESAVADPDRYLVRWREHGPLAPAIDALRAALTEPLRRAAPSLRPALAASVEPRTVQAGLERAVDRAIARQDRTAPTSRVWPLIGLLQTVATAAIALSVAWVVVWILARPPVDSVILPVLGSVPIPFVALVASLAVGYLLARLLGLHAGWVGRRWAKGLRAEIAAGVQRELTDEAFRVLDVLEAALLELALAARRPVH